MIDVQHGGFYGRIDGTGFLHVKSDKSVVLNARILWTFSAAYQLTENPGHKLMADRAYEYFVKYFLDIYNGGARWMLDCSGVPVDERKRTQAQAIAIYALSEYHKVNPFRRALDHCKNLFDLVESNCFDAQKNGYREGMSEDWGREIADNENSQKTLETHLQLLEAYINLYKVWKDPKVKAKLQNLLRLLLDGFLGETGHLNRKFDNNWNLLTDNYSYGYDMEGSWLLYEAAVALGEPATLGEVKDKVMKMVQASLTGLDLDGGLMYEAKAEGVVNTDKYWWPQAEALVGLVNAWQITGEEFYLDKTKQVWHFVRRNMITEDLEWRKRVTKEGRPFTDEDLAGPGKCPYHNGRAMLELNYRLPA